MKLTEWEAREAERSDNSGITVRKMNSYGSIAPSPAEAIRVINFENLHILTQNHSFTIPIDNGR